MASLAKRKVGEEDIDVEAVSHALATGAHLGPPPGIDSLPPPPAMSNNPSNGRSSSLGPVLVLPPGPNTPQPDSGPPSSGPESRDSFNMAFNPSMRSTGEPGSFMSNGSSGNYAPQHHLAKRLSKSGSSQPFSAPILAKPRTSRLMDSDYTTSPSSATSVNSPLLLSMIDKTPIPAPLLLNHLITAQGSPATSPISISEDGCEYAVLRSDTRVLLVDVRDAEDYKRTHIKGSLNVNIPVIIANRLARGSRSFKFYSLLSAEARAVYDAWWQSVTSSSNHLGTIVVYDEDMEEGEAMTDAWHVYVNLAQVFAENEGSADLKALAVTTAARSNGVSPNKPETATSSTASSTVSSPRLGEGVCVDNTVTVAYLRGGFRALADLPAADTVLVNDGESLSPVAPLLGPKGNTNLRARAASALSSPTIDTMTVPNRNNQRKRSAFSINTGTPLTAKFGGKGLKGSSGNPLNTGAPLTGRPLGTTFDDMAGSAMNGNPPPLSYLGEAPEPTENAPGGTQEDPMSTSPQTAMTSPQSAQIHMEPVSKILDHLYLGSDSIPQAADAVAQLQALGVTHVLNMAIEIDDAAVAASGQFGYKWCRLEDHAEQDIEIPLKDAVQFLVDGRRERPDGALFVHCKAGKSRSATAVLAFLMIHERMTLQEAYTHVRRIRSGISPNIGFMSNLIRLERELFGKNTFMADLNQGSSVETPSIATLSMANGPRVSD